MSQDCVLSWSMSKMPDDYLRMQDQVKLNEKQSFSGAISMKASSGAVIAMVILLVFFIIGSGYLLIYNVLYISISKDTRFYGLMKPLGTTQAQIKSLVKNQAVKFACIDVYKRQELYLIVDYGGRVLDVIVEHPLYGQISGQLQIHSRYDVDNFLAALETYRATPLCNLTDGVHLHTIWGEEESVYRRMIDKLREKGFLFEAK